MGSRFPVSVLYRSSVSAFPTSIRGPRPVITDQENLRAAFGLNVLRAQHVSNGCSAVRRSLHTMGKGIRAVQIKAKPMATGYVAYYRVSTDKQGESGLGLEAQREAAKRIARQTPILNEFVEIETAKKSTAKNRPQLLAAIADCKRLSATLLIAKLDRLARNVHFISGLMEAGVDFVAADMPQANRLTLHIMAAFAEHEAHAISERTKAALAALKTRGVKLGNPRWYESIEKARSGRILKIARPSDAVIENIQRMRAESASLRSIAARLNELGVRTPRGGYWHATCRGCHRGLPRDRPGFGEGTEMG